MLPERRGPDLAGLAVFTLDPAGRVASWSVTAARLFGREASEAAGRDICDVLMGGAGQRELMSQALAEVAMGRNWAATLPMPTGGDGQVAVHCEPLAGAGGGALVIARRVVPRPGPDLLREAATRIGTTLELARTAREFAGVAVPAFADAAAIFVSERLLATEEPGSHAPGPVAVVRRLAARVAGQPATLTDSLLRPGEVVAFAPGSPSFRAITAGSPVLSDHLDEETAQRLSRHPGGREITTAYTSFLAVPLTARGLVLGCATFARMAGSPGFGPADLTTAGDLAAHTAVCIDNARLYHRERRTAFALQQGLLPGEPQIPEAVEVASRYLPVGVSVVGGDWHDIVALPGGKTALIVGDVMGHGPEAAAVMVQLRTAAHTLADVGLPPGELLRRLDQMAAALPGPPYATCVCAVIDPAADSCVVARAGHPPPVLALPDGTTQVLDLPAGLLLGLATGPFQESPAHVPPGATLALYTDGLVESRTRALDNGLAALCDALSSALAQPGATLDSCCETVTQALRQRGEDDITLMLARIR
jgi:stage II sporulation SpoE-like protein/PAS domain-containing protein/GAF domain-containing protein